MVITTPRCIDLASSRTSLVRCSQLTSSLQREEWNWRGKCWLSTLRPARKKWRYILRSFCYCIVEIFQRRKLLQIGRIMVKTFVDTTAYQLEKKTAKSMKVFSLESFHLYYSIVQYSTLIRFFFYRRCMWTTSSAAGSGLTMEPHSLVDSCKLNKQNSL